MTRLIIDVREPSEYLSGHVDGAINIPPSELMEGSEKLSEVPKDTELVLYCLSGSRSNASIKILEQQGYTNLVNGINRDHVMMKYADEF